MRGHQATLPCRRLSFHQEAQMRKPLPGRPAVNYTVSVSKCNYLLVVPRREDQSTVVVDAHGIYLTSPDLTIPTLYLTFLGHVHLDGNHRRCVSPGCTDRP